MVTLDYNQQKILKLWDKYFWKELPPSSKFNHPHWSFNDILTSHMKIINHRDIDLSSTVRRTYLADYSHTITPIE